MGEWTNSGAEIRQFILFSQFYDLIEIFRIGGYAPNTNYLFLGRSRSQSREEDSILIPYPFNRRLCR